MTQALTALTSSFGLVGWFSKFGSVSLVWFGRFGLADLLGRFGLGWGGLKPLGNGQCPW